jgi:site-specific recombinase XerD
MAPNVAASMARTLNRRVAKNYVNASDFWRPNWRPASSASRARNPSQFRMGNWLSQKQAQALLTSPDITTLKGLRDRAIIAVLLGCGLRGQK